MYFTAGRKQTVDENDVASGASTVNVSMKQITCLSPRPQLFPERLHQSADERQIQQVSSVCADILLGEPGGGLSALPGSHLCPDRLRYLHHGEYKTSKGFHNSNPPRAPWTLEEAVQHVIVWTCNCRTVFKEQLGLQTLLEQLTVLLDLYRDQRTVSIYPEWRPGFHCAEGNISEM